MSPSTLHHGVLLGHLVILLIAILLIIIWSCGHFAELMHKRLYRQHSLYKLHIASFKEVEIKQVYEINFKCKNQINVFINIWNNASCLVMARRINENDCRFTQSLKYLYIKI